VIDKKLLELGYLENISLNVKIEQEIKDEIFSPEGNIEIFTGATVGGCINSSFQRREPTITSLYQNFIGNLEIQYNNLKHFTQLMYMKY
jgi:hypothetical protein